MLGGEDSGDESHVELPVTLQGLRTLSETDFERLAALDVALHVSDDDLTELIELGDQIFDPLCLRQLRGLYVAVVGVGKIVQLDGLRTLDPLLALAYAQARVLNSSFRIRVEENNLSVGKYGYAGKDSDIDLKLIRLLGLGGPPRPEENTNVF